MSVIFCVLFFGVESDSKEEKFIMDDLKKEENIEIDGKYYKKSETDKIANALLKSSENDNFIETSNNLENFENENNEEEIDNEKNKSDENNKNENLENIKKKKKELIEEELRKTEESFLQKRSGMRRSGMYAGSCRLRLRSHLGAGTTGSGRFKRDGVCFRSVGSQQQDAGASELH